jgi:3-dehydroquinate dehydratase type I
MNKKLVCASLVGETLSEMVSSAKKTEADLVEMRLDHIKERSDLKAIRDIKKPVIATCMPKWEGGLFCGTEEKRMAILEDALPFVRYLTVELNTEPKLRDRIVKKAKQNKVKVIIASHDFEKTPPLAEIIKIIARERDAGADIAKVAFTPKNEADVLSVLRATVEHSLSIPVIALSMGELGRASRIVGPLLGSYLTYAAESDGRKAAAGQFTVSELSGIFERLSRNPI